jgi:HK97 family phage major capsid protein
MTMLRQRMLEELQRHNYSQSTIETYINSVKDFAVYFHKSPDLLGAEEVRRYQLYLLNEKKLTAQTVKVRMLFVFSEETLTSNAVSWANVLNMIAAVLGADVRGGRMGWTFNAYVQAYLRKTLKESGDAGTGYLMDAPNSMAGYPVEITSQMAGDPNSSPAVSGTMLFGDFSQVILAFWGEAGADILVNPYADSVYTKGNVLIRAFVDADVLIRHPEGFCFCDGITL